MCFFIGIGELFVVSNVRPVPDNSELIVRNILTGCCLYVYNQQNRNLFLKYFKFVEHSQVNFVPLVNKSRTVLLLLMNALKRPMTRSAYIKTKSDGTEKAH